MLYSVQIKRHISQYPRIYQIIQYTINAIDSVQAIDIALGDYEAEYIKSLVPVFMIDCHEYIGPDIISREKMEPINITEMIEEKEEDKKLP